MPHLEPLTLILAHAGHGDTGFVSGLLHPLHGVDHLLAMVAVGLLAARLAVSRLWVPPLAFVAMMGVGGLVGLATAGAGIGVMEWGIVASVLIFALLVAATPKAPIVAGSVIVGVFAVCHGFAHAAEMGEASAWAYFPGMLLGTTALHLGGLAAGLALKRSLGEASIRAAGAVVALAFVATLVPGLA